MPTPFDVFFCGMDLMVRVWKDADPAVANEDSRHEVFIVGCRAGGAYGIPNNGISEEPIPEHEAHLAVPAIRLQSADSPPNLLVESDAGPLAIWKLDGVRVNFLDALKGGVAFRDRLRPASGPPSPATPGDWEDIAWVCDYQRASRVGSGLTVNLRQPPGPGPASYVARLNSGMLLAQPPRRSVDRQAIYDFGNGYKQALTDIVRWRLPKPTRVELLSPSGSSNIIAVTQGPIYFTSLSTSIKDLGAAEMGHFSGFGSLFGQSPGPTPIRTFDPTLIVDGQVGTSGGICLRSMVNVLQSDVPGSEE
jgi:hypothetical protein